MLQINLFKHWHFRFFWGDVEDFFLKEWKCVELKYLKLIYVVVGVQKTLQGNFSKNFHLLLSLCNHLLEAVLTVVQKTKKTPQTELFSISFWTTLKFFHPPVRGKMTSKRIWYAILVK